MSGNAGRGGYDDTSVTLRSLAEQALSLSFSSKVSPLSQACVARGHRRQRRRRPYFWTHRHSTTLFRKCNGEDIHTSCQSSLYARIFHQHTTSLSPGCESMSPASLMICKALDPSIARWPALILHVTYFRLCPVLLYLTLAGTWTD